MLLRYGARNFYCFREGVEISLELGAKCPESISRGKSVTNLLCFKGANGSGKTNILKALSFLNDFCCHSFGYKPEDKITIDSFFNNENPIDLFCDFLINKIRYRYELCLTKRGVISEKLHRKIKRFSPVFIREENKLTYCLKEFHELHKVKLRNNSSLISTAHQYEMNCILPIYQFFNSIIVNVAWLGKVDITKDYRSISEYYKTNRKILDKSVSIIKEFDLGIEDIKIHTATEENGSRYFFPIFIHDVKNAKENWLTYYSESLGTQTLFRSLPAFLYILEKGGILVMDEFDTDYHPHMLKKIVSYFDNENSNPKNAQMLFSTHNTDILEYMGKYRTVFVNKEESESYGYRLDEIPGDIIRNDRPIAPVYNSGKIGGVPRI